MNKSFPSLFLFIGAASVCAITSHAQSSAAPILAADPVDVAQPRPPRPGDDGYVERLDAMIITGTADPKAAFDFAQGASSLSGKRLQLQQESTLGETLERTPGVNSTYYGPGASRPLIRGLGGDRVRMLEDSIGSLDLSSISPDHNVSIEPLLLERIEVLRGPATLLYGSSAVGGVVNVIDNRIPLTAPDAPLGGRVEGRFNTVANERTGVMSLLVGNAGFGLQVNGLRTLMDDVDISGYAQQGPDAPADQPRGTLPGSAISTKSGSVGGTAFFKTGFVGLAVSEYDTAYGVPTGDDPAISIDMKQRRLDLRGELASPFGFFKTLRVRAGYGDYTHSELSGGATVNTLFKNKAWESRVELVQETLDKLSGTIGLQFSQADFLAEGEEVVTPATLTRSAAIFALEEYKLEQVTFQLGGRYEWQRIGLGELAAGLPTFDGYAAQSGAKRTDRGVSVSTGAVYYPAKNYSVGFSLAASQRLPGAQELYSNGPHGGSAAYEVGRSNLGKEKSIGVDLTLRRRGDFMTGSVGVFMNKFRNFIFEEELPEALKPVVNNPDGLTAFQFVAKNALFYGGEAELEFHLIDREGERLHFVLDGDYVRAEQTTDDQPLPRIPPLRAGAELRYERGAWTAGVNLRHVFRQGRFAEFETATSGYTLLGADLGYGFMFGRVRYDIFLRGSNLTNEAARVHTSFLKDFAPLPGRNVTLGVRAEF